MTFRGYMVLQMLQEEKQIGRTDWHPNCLRTPYLFFSLYFSGLPAKIQWRITRWDILTAGDRNVSKNS